jgi:hypothetical protein
MASYTLLVWHGIRHGILHASRMMRAGNGGRLRCPVSLSKDDTLVGFVGRGRRGLSFRSLGEGTRGCQLRRFVSFAARAVLLTVLVIWVVGYP